MLVRKLSAVGLLLDRLRNGETCCSLGIRTARNVDIVRMAASIGYDLAWIDLEHSTIPLDVTAQMCATARDLGIGAWVRVPEGDFGVIGRVLDGGASGIIVPHVVTAADARRAVSFCRYPSEGGRSHNALTSAFGFRRVAVAERAAAANQEIVVQALLETPEAAANADEIAAIDGIDILGLGLNDLTAAMGLGGDVRAAPITELCRHVIDAARRHGKLAVIGGLAGSDHYQSLVDLGAARFAFTAIDTDLLVEALQKRLDTWRAMSVDTNDKVSK